ncbi:MAG TPA: AsmA-like C-terminal region-containing protein, partial [Puia sp.]|nr:AsmA-like C-terminal region-containing protein [Puia sp.]
GKTLIAFDLRSRHLAMNDLLGNRSRLYIPKDYQREVGSNIWLRSKVELRYDSSFRFANIRIGNVSGSLLRHDYQLDSIMGNVKFGVDNYVKIDTLKGKIGRSDFLINMRLYAGTDTNRRKKENYLQFNSRFLDVDQLTNYYQTAGQADTLASPPPAEDSTGLTTAAPANDSTAQVSSPADTAAIAATRPPSAPVSPQATAPLTVTPAVEASPSASSPATFHQGFNIFQIPFIDFNASVHVNHLRYHHLGIRNFETTLRMRTNQQLYLDTLDMNVAGGSISASGQFNGVDSHKVFRKSRINVEDVDVGKLMVKLDYLGQDYVINKNIRGSLSGQVDSYLQMTSDLTPMVAHSEARIDLEILNGSLVNFAPMHAVSGYFKDKNLNMIRFDTLRNTLTLKNGILSIPDMDINSSLGYMEISGQQSMDTHMEYYLRIPLKLVTEAGFHKLFGKKREEVNPDQVDAIEYRDKEKKVRFMNLKIVGTPDDYKVSLGKAKKSQS